MWRLIIYLMPVLINLILGGMFYISAYRLAATGQYSKLAITCAIAMWSIMYCLFTLVMGKVTTPRRAPRFLIVSAILLALVCLGCVVFPQEAMQFVWLGLAGIVIAGYCTPFQIFAKDLETTQTGGVSRAAASYNISWSIGMALGPSLFGSLDLHWQIGYYVNALLCLLMVAGLLYLMWLKKSGRLQGSTDAPVDYAVAHEYDGRPNLVYVGWICIGLGSVYIAALRALEPIYAENLGIGTLHGGLILAVVSYVQVAGSLMLVRSRKWMYGVWPLVVTCVFGVVGMLLFAFEHRAGILYLAALLVGIYSTSFYFMGVFHSLVHPTRSVKYVSINETLVGICGVLGSMGGGLLVDLFGYKATFIGMGALAVVSLALQLILRKRAR